jgi:SAM-dependent methyltransferase
LIDVYYDGKTIPFDDRYFDSVYSSEVLQHISDIEPIIAEIERVLKKGGYLLITVPFVWHESGQPIDGVRYTSFGIVNLLERHGLKIIHQKKMGNYFTTTIQTRNAYLYHVLFPGPALVKLILTAVFISPYNLLGVILSPILGRNQDLFSNMVIVAQKTESL